MRKRKYQLKTATPRSTFKKEKNTEIYYGRKRLRVHPDQSGI